jgi:hypothetical protein
VQEVPKEPFDLSKLLSAVKAKTGLKVTKNFFPEYSRRGTRAVGKTYDKPMHNLSKVEGV